MGNRNTMLLLAALTLATPLAAAAQERTPPPRADDRIRSTWPWNPKRMAASAVGSIVGAGVGYWLPSVFAPDDCQETCAGMWISVPAGSIFGAAGGATLTGAEGRDALLGSAIGFGSGILTGVLIERAEIDHGEFVFLAVHAIVTAWWTERR